MLLGYCVGWAYKVKAGGWTYAYGVSVPVAITMFIGVYSLPPSARWLALHGRLKEARSSMSYVMPGVTDAQFESVAAAANEVSDDGDQSSAAVCARLSGPTCRRAMEVGMGLVILQQLTGQPSVLYYVDEIFDEVRAPV